MNWFKGSVAEAVSFSKSKNAIFVVFVEGTDELTNKLQGFINEEVNRCELESENFVAIKVESISQSYKQFSEIYKNVPIPSIYFIGETGRPLEIGTGDLNTAEELTQTIGKVLNLAKKTPKSATFVDKFSDISSSSSTDNSTTIHDTNNKQVVCDGDVCYVKRNISDTSNNHTADQSFKIPISVNESDGLDSDGQQIEKTVTESIAEVEDRVLKLSGTGNEELHAEKPLEKHVFEMSDKNTDSESKLDVDEKQLKIDEKQLKTGQINMRNEATNIVASMMTEALSNNTKTDDIATTSVNATASDEKVGNNNEQLEESRKLLEKKRRERIEEERNMEQERELQRRRDGKELRQFEMHQKELELKELKANMRRDRLEEQAVRERIRAQIAADRAERSKSIPISVEIATTSQTTASPTAPLVATTPDTTRLQFRLSNGVSKTDSFNCQDCLSVVRSYVKTELLQGTGIKDFILATTYPKREFTIENERETLEELGLFPSAVILVINKESANGPAAIIARNGGLINMLTSIMWTLFTPVMALYGYIKSFAGGNENANKASTGAQKRASDNQTGVQSEVIKKRNLDRLGGNPSPSGASTSSDNSDQRAYRRYGPNIHRLADNRKDSDDENATWNGNSTQQQ